MSVEIHDLLEYVEQVEQVETASDRLARVDPRLKLAVLLVVSILSVVLDATLSLVGLVLVVSLLLVELRLSLRAWGALLVLLVLVAWSTMLSQAMFYSASPQAHVWQFWTARHWGGVTILPALRLTDEGAIYGLEQSLRLIAGTIAGLVVALSTSPQRLLAALAQWRVPSVIGFTTVTAVRFLPTLVSEYATVRRARRMRGYRARWLPWRWPAGVRMAVATLLPLLAATLRRASLLGTAAVLRGFDPCAARSHYPPLQMRRGERWCLLVLLLGAAAICWTKC